MRHFPCRVAPIVLSQRPFILSDSSHITSPYSCHDPHITPQNPVMAPHPHFLSYHLNELLPKYVKSLNINCHAPPLSYQSQFPVTAPTPPFILSDSSHFLSYHPQPLPHIPVMTPTSLPDSCHGTPSPFPVISPERAPPHDPQHIVGFFPPS